MAQENVRIKACFKINTLIKYLFGISTFYPFNSLTI